MALKLLSKDVLLNSSIFLSNSFWSIALSSLKAYFLGVHRATF
jgi:hypothetical protein